MACGPLFSIDANADGKTSAERVQIVQRNLDNALVAAKNRTAESVQVRMMNHNPIVTLDNYYLVTADKNSATRNGISQLALAERWAESIRRCLADTAMVDKYISMLTGDNGKSESTAAYNRTDVAVLPWGTNLPVTLQTHISVPDAVLGLPVKAALTTDVPLGPGFCAYLPKGTVALGKLVDGEPYNPNNYAGHHVLMPYFYALKAPDGAEIPIDGHLLGGVNSWRAVTIVPLQPAYDKRVAAVKYVDVNEGVSTNGTGGTKLLSVDKQEVVESNSLPAYNGVISGGWRGLPEDAIAQEGFPRLLLSPKSRLFIPAGTRMTLQLAASTSIAVSSAAPPSAAIAAAVKNPAM